MAKTSPPGRRQVVGREKPAWPHAQASEGRSWSSAPTLQKTCVLVGLWGRVELQTALAWGLGLVASLGNQDTHGPPFRSME